MLGNYCSQILVIVLRGEVLKIIKIFLDSSSTFATVNMKFSKNLKYHLNLENSYSFFLFFSQHAFINNCLTLL